MVSGMIEKLLTVLKPEPLSEDTKGLLRLPPLSYRGEIDSLMFSGGVSEFIYNREKTSFGDLGPLIAEEIHRRMPELGLLVMEPAARIRATVIGASQYTIQVSGNTIFISPEDAVPVRNIPVVAPEFDFDGEDHRSESHRPGGTKCAAQIGPAHRQTTGGVIVPMARLSDFRPAKIFLRRRRRGTSRDLGQAPSVDVNQ